MVYLHLYCCNCAGMWEDIGDSDSSDGSDEEDMEEGGETSKNGSPKTDKIEEKVKKW